MAQRAAEVMARCAELARVSDVEGQTTRTFLSRATLGAHALLLSWMMQAGLSTRTDDTGSVRGFRPGASPDAPILILFSHIDTVPNAGRYDGPLGVLLSLAALHLLRDQQLPFAVEVVAFSEEEGIRFGFPFLSSLAATGRLTSEHLQRTDANGISLADAVRHFGLNPERIAESARLPRTAFAALEVHIEQGPVLDTGDVALGIVSTIAGQSRFEITFQGASNHAGTTPMPLRQDALCAAAEWIGDVERFALKHKQLVATVGRVQVEPNAVNVVPGRVTVSLDVRHPGDESRHAAVGVLLTQAERVGERRGVKVSAKALHEQRAVDLDTALGERLAEAASLAGYSPLRMYSGAGHDSMILAPHVPTAMLFVRSPGGISHHPDETVRGDDVEAALYTVVEFLRTLKP